MSEQDEQEAAAGAESDVSTDPQGTGDESAAPVLSDDEKNALLDGVASGEIEVQSADGPHYAAVTPYVISQRAHLKSNTLPRLATLNEQLANNLAANCADLLQVELEISARTTRMQPFGDFCTTWPGRSVAVAFTANPLSGKGLIVFDSVLIGPLVEAFFGGNSPESKSHSEASHSAGSLSVVQLFAAETLGVLRDVWAPLQKLSPDREELQVGLDTVDAIAADERVVHTEFELQLGDRPEDRGSFCIVWPEASLAPVREALAGRTRERDPAEDARWQKILRQRLPEVVLGLESTVGRVRMTLADVMRLKPGDVIGIDTPRIATINARDVPLIEGRFGVHAGRNAIETVAWLEPQIRN